MAFPLLPLLLLGGGAAAAIIAYGGQAGPPTIEGGVRRAGLVVAPDCSRMVTADPAEAYGYMTAKSVEIRGIFEAALAEWQQQGVLNPVLNAAETTLASVLAELFPECQWPPSPQFTIDGESWMVNAQAFLMLIQQEGIVGPVQEGPPALEPAEAEPQQGGLQQHNTGAYHTNGFGRRDYLWHGGTVPLRRQFAFNVGACGCPAMTPPTSFTPGRAAARFQLPSAQPGVPPPRFIQPTPPPVFGWNWDCNVSGKKNSCLYVTSKGNIIDYGGSCCGEGTSSGSGGCPPNGCPPVPP